MFPCTKKKNIIPFFGYRKPLIRSYEYSFGKQEIHRVAISRATAGGVQVTELSAQTKHCSAMRKK